MSQPLRPFFPLSALPLLPLLALPAHALARPDPADRPDDPPIATLVSADENHLVGAAQTVTAVDTADFGILGDLWGTRSRLRDAGIHFGGAAIFEVGGPFRRGLDRRASSRHLVELYAELDTERLLGLRGGEGFISFVTTNEHRTRAGGTADIGTWDFFSNIETDRSLDVIYEAWYAHRFFNDALELKAGKIDANNAFAFVEPASLFIASAAGFSPTIVGFPTYPDPAFGAVASLTPAEHLAFSFGFFDGSATDGVRTGRLGPAPLFRADEYFLIGEGRFTWGDDASPNPFAFGEFAAGVWHHTDRFERFDGTTTRGATGFYLVSQLRLLARERADGEGGGGLYFFSQFGWANDRVSDVGQHHSAGLVLRGTFPGRDDDEAGVYFSYLDLSDAEGSPFERDEWSIEATYSLKPHPALSIQPGLQFIRRPGGDPAIRDTVVGFLRFEAAF